ncbi:MAG: hypothetical protein JNL08_05995 [Planctomycetes bacterium]|nr:hypothetical protein [Planctomycetota bacterium]
MKHVFPCVCWLTIAAACSTAPAPLVAPDPTVLPTLTAAEFPGAGALRFDERHDDASWHGDDAVVFALRLRKGEIVHRWLLRLEVLLGEELVARVDGGDSKIRLWENRTWQYSVMKNGQEEPRELRSRVMPVTVTVSDEHGKPLTRSMVRLPTRLLGGGLLPAIDLTRELVAQGRSTVDAGDTDIEPVVAAIVGTLALLNVVQEDDALAEYFWQVVEKPSVWSILTGLGVRATMSMEFEHSVPAPRLPAGLPAVDRAFLVPLRIDVNGSPALLADVVAVDARRPYALCGGMVAAVARHPSNPDITFELQLLGAERGAAAPRATAEIQR